MVSLSICNFLYGKLEVAEEQGSPEGYEGQFIDSVYPFLHYEQKDPLYYQGFPKYELVLPLLFARGGELRFEQQFPSTRCRSWLLSQLAAIVVVLPSVEHSRTTTNSSELEIYMYVCR